MTNHHGNEDLVADYLGEAGDHLEQLNKLLLEVAEADAPWPAERLVELFRSAHSLKGLSACFGFERTSAVTHQLESLMTMVREGRLLPSEAVVRLMFDAIDLVQNLTAEIASSGHEHATTEFLLEDMRRTMAAAGGNPPPTPDGPAAKRGASASALHDAGAVATQGAADANETVRVRMERLDRMVNLTGELVVARSRFQLAARQLRPMQRLADLTTSCQELLRGLGELEANAGKGTSRDDGARAQLLGQLIDHAQRVQAGCRDFAGMGRVLRDLDDVAQDFDGVVGGIHEAVLQLRMVPLETVFRRLHRAVRDTAETLHKPVDFEVTGGDTQIDKRVADELVSPLVHLLRNAVDHGLEAPGARTAAGKPARGHIVVTSYQRGSSVVLEVRDDGAGIDPARVLAKAVQLGLVTADEAAVMPPHEAQRLVFAPGFSTAAKVTEVSGRGMGMDIVASTIKKLRGSLELHSEVGRGTCFKIQLPPSMSILSSLLLEARGTMFALPLTEVREIVELQRVAVQNVQSRRMIVVRDRPMPLVLLPEAYRFPGTAPPGADDGAVHAVVFGFPGREVALGVDRLVGKEDLVIKPLCPELAAVRGLAGMAIRGDGRVTLILDPSGFADHALAGAHAATVRTAR